MDEVYTSYETLYTPSEKVLTRTKWKYREVWPLRWRKGMSKSHRRKCLHELGEPASKREMIDYMTNRIMSLGRPALDYFSGGQPSDGEDSRGS